ncbi:mannitol-1-phosphate 5-dehydrogenase [Escherichia coli]|nr:mannitol-1-phosphate 5-dehydrogenase [Escherichia coli]
MQFITRLIRPTNLCLNRRSDKAFTPHPAVMRRCQMRRPKAAHPQ